MNTPELDKMLAVKDKSLILSGFIDWLHEQQYVLAQYEGGFNGDELIPVFKDPEHLLADFFGIDLKKAEKERVALLESLRTDQNL